MITLSFIAGGNPLHYPLTLFIIQLLLIVVLARLIGIVLVYFNQPRVIAEVVGGILLGQSALSKIPAFKNAIFPQESLPALSIVSEIGLILFLFLVGLEMDPKMILTQAKRAVSISFTGIFLTFCLSLGTSKALFELVLNDEERAANSFVVFLLFNGVAMSITAFPVLARILSEQELLSTEVGQLCIATAAVDDSVAWLLLLVIVALINNVSQAIVALYVFLATAAFLLFLVFAIRPIFTKLVQLGAENDQISQFSVFAAFMLVFASAWFTEAVGVSAIFGGFMAGLIIPHEHGFAIKLTEKIEDVITILFLPLYFAFSGLNTRLDKLNSGIIAGMVFLTLATACTGKIVGVFSAARFNKIQTREALALGVLMNTKGLVELIILNIGLQAGVINDTIFTIMVVMALATTFMTSPLISWIYPKSKHRGLFPDSKKKILTYLSLPNASINNDENDKPLKVLLTLKNNNSSRPMMSVMQLLAPSSLISPVEITALRLLELGDRIGSVMRATQASEVTLRSDPVLNIFKTFATLNHYNLDAVLIVSLLKDFAEHIVSTAESNDINLIVLSHPPFSTDAAEESDHANTINSQIKHMMEDILNKQYLIETVRANAHCSVAVMIDRGFNVSESLPMVESSENTVKSFASMRLRTAVSQLATLYVPFIGGPDDREAILFALNFHRGVNVHFLIIHAEAQTEVDDDLVGSSFQLGKSPSHNDFSSAIEVNQLGSDDVQADEALLDSLRQKVQQSMVESNTSEYSGVMTIDEVTTPYSMMSKEMIQWTKSSHFEKRDLLVLGKGFYEKGTYNQGTHTLKNHMDSVFHGSVAIIQRGGKGSS